MMLRNKNLISKFVLSLLITAFSAERLHAENIDLLVLAGQSNMQGVQGDAAQYPADPKGYDQKIKFYWVTPGFSSSQGQWTHLQPQGGCFAQGHFGPEITLARLLAANGHDLAVFKYSQSGTSLASDWKTPGLKGMYDQMVVELKQALSLLEARGHKINFLAFIWIQGESDAPTREWAETYGAHLKLLLDHFRNKVAGNTKLPIILGVDEQHPQVVAFPQVVQHQQKLAATEQNIIFSSMLGLEKADNTHLTPKGLEKHGERLFAAYQTLTTKVQPAAAPKNNTAP